MKELRLRVGLMFGALTAVPVIALIYFGKQAFQLPFVPFRLFDWLARVLPGGVITLGIDSLVALIGLLNLGSTDSTAKIIEQLMALGLFVALGALLGLATLWLFRQNGRTERGLGAVAGGVVFVLFAVVEASLGFAGDPLLTLGWLVLMCGGWGLLLAHLLILWSESESPESAEPGRRALLGRLLGGSALVALSAWGLGHVLSVGQEEVGASLPLDLGPEPSATGAARSSTASADVASTPFATQTTPPATDGRLTPAPGTRPELTSNESFYRIDINALPPVLDRSNWTLEVNGLFERTGPMTLADLMAYPPVTQPITLSCISNQVGGDLIGTSNWTGVRLGEFLADRGLQPQAQVLFIQAADGFYETVSPDDMMDPRSLLVYGMNGETLPVEHGFPLRIYLPNRYGMKQPKWITSITATAEPERGYWVDRGWSKEARPQIVSVIDNVASDQLDEEGRIAIGGIAWAGDRGIAMVELRIDDGDWQEADLRTPPLSPLTWVQWRYDWPATPGRHEIQVRAVDGTGTLQTEDRSGVRPDGATGYHSVRFTT